MNAELLKDLYGEQTPNCRQPDTEAEEALTVLPVPEPVVTVDEHSTLGLVELLLKAPRRVDELARDEVRQAELLPRYLGVVLASFSLFALALVLILNYAESDALPVFLRPRWKGGFGSAFSLWAAYTLGMIAATGVCLPSFYFFGLLAGVRVSVLQVIGHVMKGKASTALMLLGILPIYLAVVLGMVVFAARPDFLQLALYGGLVLPFVAGLWGVWSIYRGFLALADTLPAARRYQRGCFLRRLTLAWAACYTAVTPVMIWTLWNYFAERLA